MKKLIIVIISLVLFVSCFENMDNLKNKNRIFRTEDKFFVVYEGKTFEMPKDLYLTQNKKVEQYFTTGFLKKIVIIFENFVNRNLQTEIKIKKFIMEEFYGN